MSHVGNHTTKEQKGIRQSFSALLQDRKIAKIARSQRSQHRKIQNLLTWGNLANNLWPFIAALRVCNLKLWNLVSCNQVQYLAKTWIYLTPYVCTERIYDSQPVIYTQTVFLTTLLEVGNSHRYTSFCTLWVQIGQLFEAQGVFKKCLKTVKSKSDSRLCLRS